MKYKVHPNLIDIVAAIYNGDKTNIKFNNPETTTEK